MVHSTKITLSVVVPLFNEADCLRDFHAALEDVLNTMGKNYEIIYCNDGSSDKTLSILHEIVKGNARTKVINLSRNFGKESALSAGLHAATGQAIIALDGDGQHPVEVIPKFVEAWEQGGQVIVGVCVNRRSEGLLKRLGSRLFYKSFNALTGQKLVSGTTDFRLIDRAVQQEFIKLEESERMTRALIDWLGFERVYVQYEEKTRIAGAPAYSFGSLVKLATNSFVALTPKPLYIFGYLGITITAAAFLLGVTVFIEQILLSDPWHWKFTGTAMLGILILFLVGIVLLSQGILSLYISHIHSQSKGRPLYVINKKGSVGIDES